MPVEITLQEFIDICIRALDKLKFPISNRFSNIQQARNDARLMAFLEYYYPQYVPTLVKIGNLTYPIAGERLNRVNVDSLLGDLDEKRRNKYLCADNTYLTLVRILDFPRNKLYNGDTYVMDRYSDGILYCSLGKYFDSLRTCNSVEWELLQAFSKFRNKAELDFDNLKKYLPLRNKYHKYVENPARDGRGRSAAIGISTLVVYNDSNTYRALLWMRSAKTASDPSLLHVIPSSMFSFMPSFIKEEYSIKHTFFREYLEELFGRTEVEEIRNKFTYNYFYDDEILRSLLDMLDQGSAELRLTGYGLNLLNLRPEVCLLLIVRDEKWAKFLNSNSKVNWEFINDSDRIKNTVSGLLSIDINTEVDTIIKQIADTKAAFVPPGAAAFWWGVQEAKATIFDLHDL